MDEAGRKSFYMQDDLGSTMQLMDEEGYVRESYAYDEFGVGVHSSEVYTARDIFTNPLQPFGYTGYQMDSVGNLYFAQARRYDAGAGRFVSEDMVKGSILAPFTMNHYGYCWNRPMDLVDLNGMWPSLSEVGDSIANFYYDNREIIDTVVKVTSVVATVAAVGAVAVGTGGVGLVFAAGVLMAGTIGGFANESAGGSYTAGFLGGSATGAIQCGLSLMPGVAGPIGNFAGGAIGSGVGTWITETIDNGDPNLEIYHEDVMGDVLASAIKGGAYGTLTASVQGITMYNDAMLIADPAWANFSGYSTTMGNVMNTFYGAVTAGLANESSFENVKGGCPE